MERAAPAAAWAMPALLALVAGCPPARLEIEPRPGQLPGLLPAEVDSRAAAIRQDPVAYLRQVAERCRGLEQYTLTFVRYERRGLFQTLHGPEHIRCWFRRSPFSVRMRWLDPDVKYGETVYVAGQADDRVRFVTRTWNPPLRPPPAVNRVDLQTPVLWGESKRPLTDFGLERMMDQTLESLAAAGPDVLIRYEGLRHLRMPGPPPPARDSLAAGGSNALPGKEGAGQGSSARLRDIQAAAPDPHLVLSLEGGGAAAAFLPPGGGGGPAALSDAGLIVHHVRLEYPATRYRVPVQELYIDVATDLPAGTVLKLASGTIDAAYFYRDIDPAVRLADEDFLLPAEREAADPAESAAPAP